MKVAKSKEGIGVNEDFTMWSHGKEENMINIQDGNTNGIKTKVVVKDLKTGEVLFKGHNKTMLAGSEFMATRMFRISGASFTTPTYNNQISYIDEPHSSMANCMSMNYYTQVFCMGKDGCNRESAIWYPVSNKRWITPENLVPFQYVPYSSDLDPSERQIYFGRASLGTVSFYAYYFKKFDSDPIIKKQYEDGTPWTAGVYDDTSDLVAQVVVTNSLSITKDDGRDYYIHTSGINDARFNCIELCGAWTEVIDGYTYYQDIRPFTRINFPNKYLNDLNAEFSIEYSLYF